MNIIKSARYTYYKNIKHKGRSNRVRLPEYVLDTEKKFVHKVFTESVVFILLGIHCVHKTSMKTNKGQTLKVMKRRVFCSPHSYSLRSIYLQRFLLIPVVVSELCPGQYSKYKNEQRTILN